MKIIVNPHKLEIEKSPVNEKEINITKCEFEFNDIEQDLVKKAFFTLKDTTYEQIIVNGECDIPSEVLEEQGQIEIGVIAYQVEDEEYIKRYNPSPAYFTTWKGSLKEAENSSKPTPSQIEQIESEIATIQNDIIDLDNNKQDTLVSGENIKTINNQDLLGSGNIDLNETYYTKEEIDNKGYINKDVDDLTNYTKTSDLSEVALSGSYNDLSNTPDLSVYSLITETGNKINLEINPSTYVLVAKLYDKNNNLLSTSSEIDLPLETMVVGASYDSTTKEIVLVLKNGTKVRFSVADLVSGLQSEITPSNKLSSDLVDDTNQVNKFVTSSEKTSWNAKYDKPVGGIPKTDLDSSVQASLGKADSAVQDVSGKEDKSNKVTSIDKNSTDTQYPSAKCMYDSQLSQDTLIENLQEENNYLNSIIDQLPKVTGSGTNVTLNNTIEGKLGLELGSSELEQETTTGKNKLQYTLETLKSINGVGTWNNNVYTRNGITFTINDDLSINVNGTATAACYIILNNSLSLTNGTEYILSGCPASGGVSSYSLRLYTGSSYESEVGTGKTFTYSSQDLVRINIFNGITINNLTFYPMIRLSSVSDNTYEKPTFGPSPNPSYPQQIHTISGDNEIVVCGKNLISVRTNDLFINAYQDYIQTTSNVYGCIGKVKPNTTYTLKRYGGNRFNVVTTKDYPKNRTPIVSRIIGSTQETEITFTTGENDNYIFCYYSNESANVNVQLEVGNTATTYEPYQEQVKEINLGNLELCEIGDYKDEFYLATSSDTGLVSGKWYLKKNIGKVVLDGSEDEEWAIEQTGTENWYYSLRYADIFPANNYLLSNYYLRAQGISSANTIQGLSHIVGSTQWYIRIRYGTEDTVDNYKTWLSTHNLIDYYPLATPTYTLLNNTLQTQLNNINKLLKSYNGQTNLSQENNDLEFNMNASALLDLNSLIG